MLVGVLLTFTAGDQVRAPAVELESAILSGLREREKTSEERPSCATSTAGVNACWLPVGMLVGVLLTFTAGDQVRPPSVELESAILSCLRKRERPSEKRSSCQTA